MNLTPSQPTTEEPSLFIQPASALVASVFDSLLHPPRGININVWKRFSDLTGGFRHHEFTVFCGPTGTGKTEFWANVSYHLLTQGVKQYILEIETGAHDYYRRILQCEAQANLNDGQEKDAVHLEQIAVKHQKLILKKESLYFSNRDTRVTVEQLMTELEYASTHLGCEIAVIDNFNFFLDLQGGKGRNELTEADRVLHELILFVKRVPMHLVMIMHPRKTENGKVVSEFDVKGSSTSVQEAQNVLLYNRMDDEEFGRELKIAKMRRMGWNVGKKVNFKFDDFRLREIF